MNPGLLSRFKNLSAFYLTLLFSLFATNIIQAQTGVTWTSQTSASDNHWYSVTYGNGIFVAVGGGGTGDRVMTSPDGITWTGRTPAISYVWRAVTYGNGLFVAVSSNGYPNQVMTSPDGITWTSRTIPVNNNWYGVTYGNGLFVAVAEDGEGDRVMTSPDGITWTSRSAASNIRWRSVIYGDDLFVAVAITGTGNRVMTSPDGITWTSRTSASDNNWYGVTYGNGLFVAVASAGTGVGNRVMTSPDGITWTSRTSASENNNWNGVTYRNGLFVAVSSSGSGNRVMTSGSFETLPVRMFSFTGHYNNGHQILHWQTASESNNREFNIERSINGINFSAIGTVAGSGNSNTNKSYRFTDTNPLSGTTYYRLKQIDLDGKFEYSKIIALKNNTQNAGISVFPNPATHEINLFAGDAYVNSHAKLYNMEGRLLQTIHILKNRESIDIQSLAKGMYLLKLKDGVTLKWVKE